MPAHVEIELCGTRLWLLADRAIFWPARQALLVADVHIGKVRDHQFEILESYSNQPPADTAAVCDLLKNPDDNQQYVIQ